MGAIERDPEDTMNRLEGWLVEVAGVGNAQVSGVTIPRATGWSNETILFDAHWPVDGVEQLHRLVARIAPTSYSVFHENTFTRQFEVMRALAQHSDVPMADIHWYEADVAVFDSPFWIMDRVEGDIPTDAPSYADQGFLKDATPAQQAQAWNSGVDAMASIHNLDLAALGLPPGTYPDVDDTLGWLLDHYEAYLTWAEEGKTHDLARGALRRLRADKPADPPQGPTLVWGDARLSNLIFRDFEVAAVLDWEMSTIGDPLLDIGWWLFSDDLLTRGFGVPRLPGFPTAAQTARRWGERTGRATDDLDHYLVMAGFRFTVIMLRMGKLLCEIGLVPPEFAYDNPISASLARQIGA